MKCGFTSILIIVIAISLFLIISECGGKKEGDLPLLSPVATYKIDIPETSDLCFGSTKDILYTVSDNTGKVYKINITGKVLAEFQYTGNDLEGVCFVDNNFVYVAEERLRRIIKLDSQGIYLGQKDIPVENNIENNGIEGISFATFNQHFYIVNETNPGLLIETDKNLNFIKDYPLTFANDYSGICVDNINQNLWILSDLSASVNQCNMQGELIKSYGIPVNNPEGIAYNPGDSLLYIVSDLESRLYKFDLKMNK
ncbi:MAG: SdiA-regulated domain-containing protein [Bacteroidales bacterium]